MAYATFLAISVLSPSVNRASRADDDQLHSQHVAVGGSRRQAQRDADEICARGIQILRATDGGMGFIVSREEFRLIQFCTEFSVMVTPSVHRRVAKVLHIAVTGGENGGKNFPIYAVQGPSAA